MEQQRVRLGFVTVIAEVVERDRCELGYSGTKLGEGAFISLRRGRGSKWLKRNLNPIAAHEIGDDPRGSRNS